MDMHFHLAGEDSGGRFTAPAAAMEIISDSTLCLTPHGLTRHCLDCGTAYRSSVVAPVAQAGRHLCPFCRSLRTEPVLGPGDPLGAVLAAMPQRAPDGRLPGRFACTHHTTTKEHDA
jgi:hypothetical protein